MNIGVLGTGFGAYHAGLLKKNKQVDRVIVYGRNEAKLQKLKHELNVEITQSMEEIMQDPEIDIIDVCLPSDVHRKYAVEALRNGKHVFCETPVCLEMEDALAMKHAEQQYGKRILVNQFIKFDPAYRYLMDISRQGKYGKLLSLTLKRETAPLWGDLGLKHITTQLMIHDLDFLVWMAGAELPCSVWGVNGAQDGQSLVRLFFGQPGLSAEIIASSQMPGGYPFTVGYEAYFESAKLVFQESDVNGRTLSSLLEYTSGERQEIPLPQLNPYEESLGHMVQKLQDGEASFLSLDQAIHSLRIALDAMKKLKS